VICELAPLKTKFEAVPDVNVNTKAYVLPKVSVAVPVAVQPAFNVYVPVVVVVIEVPSAVKLDVTVTAFVPLNCITPELYSAPEIAPELSV
jgi:hypothetical protein